MPVFYPFICLLYSSQVHSGPYKQAQSARTNEILSGSRVYKPISDPLVTQKRYRLSQIAKRIEPYQCGDYIKIRSSFWSTYTRSIYRLKALILEPLDPKDRGTKHFEMSTIIHRGITSQKTSIINTASRTSSLTQGSFNQLKKHFK